MKQSCHQNFHFENEIVKFFMNNAYDKAKSLLSNYKMIFTDLYLGLDLQTRDSYNR